MKQNLGAWAASSGDATEVSGRIKGAVFALSAIIIFVAAEVFGITLTPADVIDLGTMLGAVGGAMFSLYGAGLALVRWAATVK